MATHARFQFILPIKNTCIVYYLMVLLLMAAWEMKNEDYGEKIIKGEENKRHCINNG